MTRHAEAGVVLLEVLVALAILASAGIVTMGLVAAALRSEHEASDRERTLAAEERVLTAATLLKRGELDQRLGRRGVGEFLVAVQRPERTLYRIALLQSRSPEVEDLVTVIYRPEVTHAQ